MLYSSAISNSSPLTLCWAYSCADHQTSQPGDQTRYMYMYCLLAISHVHCPAGQLRDLPRARVTCIFMCWYTIVIGDSCNLLCHDHFVHIITQIQLCYFGFEKKMKDFQTFLYLQTTCTLLIFHFWVSWAKTT